MKTRFNIGDRIQLTGTISGVRIASTGQILYELREYNMPVSEEYLVENAKKNGWKRKKIDRK